MSFQTQKERYLSITTPLGEGKLDLVGFSGEEELSQPFLYNLHLNSTEKALDFTQVVGQAVTVAIARGDGESRYVNGIVTRFIQAGKDAKQYRYLAEVRPWFWKLKLTRNCRIFQNMTVPTIITTLLDDLGYSDYKNSTTATYATRDYCVQYNESAFDFICRRMEEEGIYYYFEHADGVHTLVMADDAASQPDCAGLAEGVEYNPSGRFDWKHAECVLDCTVEQAVTSGMFAVDDFNFETPATDLASEVSGEQGPLRVYEYPGILTTKDDTEARAKLWLEGCEVEAKSLRGASTCRSFIAGYKFALSGHYRDDANGTYLLAGFQCHATPEDYSNSFHAIPDGVPFRPARLTRRPVIAGSQTAIVVGPSGKEIWTDEYGRIKVQFHWDQLGANDDKSSCWIRVSQGWAGKSWGAFFLPRIGMEVIVSFLDGDPDRPLVTGAVYNGTQTVPYTLPDDQTKSTMKTNTSMDGGGFNEIRFEDKKDSEELFVHAQKDMNVIVLNDATQTVTNARTATVKEADDTLTVEKGNRSVTVSKGNHSLTVSEGNRAIEVAKGNETHHVKGTRDLTVDGDETHTTGGSYTLDVTGDCTIKIGGKLALEVTGNIEIKSTGGTVTVKASTSLTNEAGTALTNKAGTALENKAGTSLTNEASLALTNKGLSVTNEAQTTLTNKGSAMQEVDGGGMLVLKGGLVKIN